MPSRKSGRSGLRRKLSPDPQENIEETDLDTAIERVRTWIEQRRIWINDHLDQIGNVYYTVTYTIDGNVVGTELVRDGGTPLGMAAPEKDGYLFIRWQNKDSHAEIGAFLVTQDTELEALYVSEEEAVKPEAVFLVYYEDWAALDDEEYWRNYETVIPEDAVSPTTVWSSSDESIATVNSQGTVTLLSEGDVEITLTLYNGLSVSYTLHVYDDDKVRSQLPEGITAKQKNLTLKVGETQQIGYFLLPEGGIFRDYYLEYESDGDDIIMVDKGNGIITGMKPGTADVTLYLYTDNGKLTSTDQCTVTVIE